MVFGRGVGVFGARRVGAGNRLACARHPHYLVGHSHHPPGHIGSNEEVEVRETGQERITRDALVYFYDPNSGSLCYTTDCCLCP
jgi:hypothetical protein